eukprot:2606966-Pyramimonas_sp.AAC.1
MQEYRFISGLTSDGACTTQRVQVAFVTRGSWPPFEQALLAQDRCQFCQPGTVEGSFNMSLLPVEPLVALHLPSARRRHILRLPLAKAAKTVIVKVVVGWVAPRRADLVARPPVVARRLAEDTLVLPGQPVGLPPVGADALFYNSKVSRPSLLEVRQSWSSGAAIKCHSGFQGLGKRSAQWWRVHDEAFEDPQCSVQLAEVI